MASIDRHKYSEDIRKGAAKFLDNLNLGTFSYSKLWLVTIHQQKSEVKQGPQITGPTELDLALMQ